MLLWLGPVNLTLGIFNLIPGFPLDGGRVLRSILWAFSNDFRRATLWASWIGRVVAWVFIVAGVAMIFGLSLPFLGAGLIGGVWLAFIGWFLNSAAVASYQQAVVQDMLEGVPVARLMRSDVHTVTPDITVSELAYSWIMGTDERAFPVMESDCLAGLVCLEDVRKVPRENWDATTVRKIMTPADQLAVASPREDASEALNELTQRDVRQMPVVEDCRVVGLLRRRDIIRWLQMQGAKAAA
jgi:CBS domain-containing protein